MRDSFPPAVGDRSLLDDPVGDGNNRPTNLFVGGGGPMPMGNASEGSAGRPGDAQPTGPLRDLHVLDLATGIAGAYCAKLLGDLGADVVKVEPPGSGDPLRRLGPFRDGRT